VLSFRATSAIRAGELDAGAELLEAALVIAPDSVGLMIALAQCLARRARTASARLTDQESSIRWAAKALDQLHEWNGPTEAALTTLLQALLASGRLAGALDRSLSSPDGRATPEEARRPTVQTTAAVAAYALGRPELSANIIDAMPNGLDRDLARARTQRSANEDEQRSAWLSLLDQLDECRPEALLLTVMRLGELGIDKSDRLNGLVARNIVPAPMQALAAASAAAAHELDKTIPQLRLLAEADETSALRLVTLLMGAERYEDAEAAATAALTRFRTVELAILRVEAVDHLGRQPEVETLLSAVLQEPTLDPLNRQVASRRLAQALMRRAVLADEPDRTKLWERFERLMTDCVVSEGAPAHDQDVWRLTDAKLHLGKDDEAYSLLNRHDLVVDTVGEARLWASVVLCRPSPTADEYTRALDLADQFAEDAQLSASLITAVVTRTRDAEDEPASPADRRLVLDASVRARAFEMLQAHVSMHGQATPIQVLTGETPEALIAQMTDFMRQDNRPLIEVVEMVRQGRLPLGFLALMAHRPYSATLAERPLGYLLSSAALEEDDTADEEAALAATGKDVVVDLSTLLVATEVGEYDKLRGTFRTLFMPTVSHADIVKGRSDLDGRSSSAGFVRYDSRADSLIASELDVDELLATLKRHGQTESASTSPVLVPDVSLDDLGEIASDDSAAWLAPIALAKERHLALWSDDVAQRRLARVLGVGAFGTTTLQQLRTVERFEVEPLTTAEVQEIVDQRQQEVLTLLEKRIVDVPTDVATVLELALREEWNDGVALVTVGRPGWWHMSINPLADLQSILREADATAAALDAWRYHAMWGAVRVADGEPARQAMLLAATALLSVSNEPDVDGAVRHLDAAHHIAAERQLEEPAAYLDEAEATLINAGVLAAGSDLVDAVRAKLDRRRLADASGL